MFTKQTSNGHVRGIKNGHLRLGDLWKKARYPSWHIYEGFEGIWERWEDCVPHQDCKSVSQNLSYITSLRHLRQLWLLARATRGHRHWWPVSKPLTFPITFHLRAVGKSSHITLAQNNHLDLSGLTPTLPLSLPFTLTFTNPLQIAFPLYCWNVYLHTCLHVGYVLNRIFYLIVALNHTYVLDSAIKKQTAAYSIP